MHVNFETGEITKEYKPSHRQVMARLTTTQHPQIDWRRLKWIKREKAKLPKTNGWQLLCEAIAGRTAVRTYGKWSHHPMRKSKH